MGVIYCVFVSSFSFFGNMFSVKLKIGKLMTVTVSVVGWLPPQRARKQCALRQTSDGASRVFTSELKVLTASIVAVDTAPPRENYFMRNCSKFSRKSLLSCGVNPRWREAQSTSFHVASYALCDWSRPTGTHNLCQSKTVLQMVFEGIHTRGRCCHSPCASLLCQAQL